MKVHLKRGIKKQTKVGYKDPITKMVVVKDVEHVEKEGNLEKEKKIT